MQKRQKLVTLEALHTHTHTSGLQNIDKKENRIIKKYKNKKDNIIMPCGYIDTG